MLFKKSQIILFIKRNKYKIESEISIFYRDIESRAEIIRLKLNYF